MCSVVWKTYSGAVYVINIKLFRGPGLLIETASNDSVEKLKIIRCIHVS